MDSTSMLSNQELAQVIKEQLNVESVVPEGHTGALIVHADNHGIRSTIATKVGKTWEVQQDFSWHPNAGGFEFGTNVIRSW